MTANPAERLVRPFVITAGRTAIDHPTLRIETLVEVDPTSSDGGAMFEAAQILAMCQTPISVAEIASALDVPLGVALVLVADLIATDRLVAHTSDPLDIELDALTRMIDRVRTL